MANGDCHWRVRSAYHDLCLNAGPAFSDLEVSPAERVQTLNRGAAFARAEDALRRRVRYSWCCLLGVHVRGPLTA
jgi:hypothetical protein